MTTRLKLLLVVLAMVASFALGTYTAKSLTDIKSSVDKTDTNIKTTTTTTTVKHGDTETTTTRTDTIQHIKEKESKYEKIDIPERRFVNVSLLGNYDQKDKKPIYGVSITSRFLGPFTAGAWVLQNKMVGLSIGVDF